VLLVSPRDKKDDVSPNDKIFIHFAPVIDEKTILDNKGIKVVSLKDNKDIQGSWAVSRKGTKFTFTPSESFAANEQYKIIVTTGIKDQRGIKLDKESVYQFKTGI